VKVVCDSVSAFVYRRVGEGVEYLLMKRTPDRGGFWQPVSGTIKKRETPEVTARREVVEETGLEPRSLVTLETVHTFHIPGKRRIYLEPCFGAEVDAGEPTLSDEHTEYRWLGVERAAAAIPFSGLREALRELDSALATAQALEQQGESDGIPQMRLRFPR
jgi:lipoyl(octanoyl) transferase